MHDSCSDRVTPSFTLTHVICPSIMFLTLLFICQVNAEWVEISQQTYRKPLTPLKIQSTIYQPFVTTTETFLGTTKKIEFFNQSLTNKHITKGIISRVSHVGIVKRVHGESVRNKNKTLHYENRKHAQQEISHDTDKEEDKISVKLNLFEENTVTPHSEENFVSNRKVTLFNRNPFLNTDRSSTTLADDQIKNISFHDENKSPHITYDSSEETLKVNEEKQNKFNVKLYNELQGNDNKDHENNIYTHSPTSTLETSIENIKGPLESIEKLMESGEVNNTDTAESYQGHDGTIVKKTMTKDTSNQQTTSSKSTIKQVNTMDEVIKILKLISKTIAQNTKRGFEGKMKYLQNMKNTLMASIESHIDAAWPDEGHRSARALQSSRSDSYVDYPSSESALMTISFLTFAVFLIKLVLQLVQKYKNTTMMTNAVLTTVKRAAAFAARPRPPDPEITYD